MDACEEQHKNCIEQARLDHLNGKISDAEEKRREALCDEQAEECKKFVLFLLSLMARAEDNAVIKHGVSDAIRHMQDCIQKAQQIADPIARATAIAACLAQLYAQLEWLGEHEGRLREAPGFIDIMKMLMPRRKLPCPCCVAGKGSIVLDWTGKPEGVDSYEEYGLPLGNPTEFNGYKEGGFSSVRTPGGLMWGFGFEVSVPYHDVDCPCECRFTQFIKAPTSPNGDWVDDVTRQIVGVRQNDLVEDRRKLWKKKCKNGRIYFGDFIQQAVSGTFYLKDVFFSASADCSPQWCSIDWMFKVHKKYSLRGNHIGFTLEGPWELGRAEG